MFPRKRLAVRKKQEDEDTTQEEACLRTRLAVREKKRESVAILGQGGLSLAAVPRLVSCSHGGCA